MTTLRCSSLFSLGQFHSTLTQLAFLRHVSNHETFQSTFSVCLEPPSGSCECAVCPQFSLPPGKHLAKVQAAAAFPFAWESERGRLTRNRSRPDAASPVTPGRSWLTSSTDPPREHQPTHGQKLRYLFRALEGIKSVSRPPVCLSLGEEYLALKTNPRSVTHF